MVNPAEATRSSEAHSIEAAKAAADVTKTVGDVAKTTIDATKAVAATAADATKAATGRRRGPRAANKAGDDSLLYCLGTGGGENGTIVLSKPALKMDVMVDALKGGVPYYCLQKFSAVVAESEGKKYEIIGVPFE